MEKPVIVVVDDDADVRAAVERDLRRQYADGYSVLSAASGPEALSVLERLKARRMEVALLIVDQRMPGMSGTALLVRARDIYPKAKRLLLTAFADTSAAIEAINQAGVDYYLLKPWDPPSERLYPVVDDCLSDWRRNLRPSFEGVTVIGHRWCARTHQLKDFLARSQAPYQFRDADHDADAKALLHADDPDNAAPLVIFPDGERVRDPSPEEIGRRLGLSDRLDREYVDLVIVGAGPAGLSAALYGASEGLSTVLVERDVPGGQAGISSRIDNYLGFPSGINGQDLSSRAMTQVKRFGAKVLTPVQAVGLSSEGNTRLVKLSTGETLRAQAVIIAAGVAWRRLGAPGEERLLGAGVYYGATQSEAVECRREEVFVVGAGNSAGQAALHMSRFASRVTLLVRGDNLAKSMSTYLINEIAKASNITVRLGVTVTELLGAQHLEGVRIARREDGGSEDLAGTAMFVFIGASPPTDWLRGVLELDERGFVVTGQALRREGRWPESWRLDREPMFLETSMPGVFAVGDVRSGSVKRVAAAVGEGSMGVEMTHVHLGTYV